MFRTQRLNLSSDISLSGFGRSLTLYMCVNGGARSGDFRVLQTSHFVKSSRGQESPHHVFVTEI